MATVNENKKAKDTVIEMKVGGTHVEVLLYPRNSSDGRPGLCAEYAIHDKEGNLLGQGAFCCSLGDIRKKVMAAYQSRAVAGEVEVGSWSWDAMKSRAKRIAKRVGAKKLLRKVNQIALDPRFQRGASMAAVIYPPFGIPMSTVAASAKLLEQVRAGDEVAQGKLLAIKQKAEGGDVKAQRVAKAIYAMNQAAKQGADVSGWAMNLPYRDNLQAGSLDRTNPGHVMRSLYSLALKR